MPEASGRPKQATRLIVVSNRLPVGTRRSEYGHWELTPAAGGLVTALEPVLTAREGIWIGSPGALSESASEWLLPTRDDDAYRLEPVNVPVEHMAGFYQGFSNEVLWPLFHDFVSACIFAPSYWESYVIANRAFAAKVMEVGTPHDIVWVHDYHLFTVGAELRAQGFQAPLGFFLHIPFPSPDIFTKLPWRRQLVRALLAYDLVGFQTTHDRDNFVACARALLPKLRSTPAGGLIRLELADGGKPVHVGAFPISIDFEHFSQRASTPGVVARAAEFRHELRERKIMLGVDRLDYTKGLTQRLAGFADALTRYPRLRRHITLMQYLVPSREDVPMYQDMRLEVEHMVGEINGRFSEPGWVPIHYFYQSLDSEALSAHYVAADIGLVTPIRDGMNLVAKEFCASHADERGVLILSEFAGAACELGGDALLVNPFDTEQLGSAIARAFDMDETEQRTRMQRMRAVIRANDVYAWVESYLEALLGPKLAAAKRTPERERLAIPHARAAGGSSASP